MSLLPARTLPWRSFFKRRHTPGAKGSYRDYRQCLRWEFGFSCCVCLAHEADLFEHGVLRFKAIPRDATPSCNCSDAAARALPAQLDEQTQAFPPIA